MKKRTRRKTNLKKRILLLLVSLSIFSVLCFYYNKNTNDHRVPVARQEEVPNIPNVSVSVVTEPLPVGTEESSKGISSNQSAKAEEVLPDPIVEMDFDITDIVKTIGNVNPDYIKIIEENLSLLPEELVQHFVSNGWKLYLTTEDIAKVYLGRKYESAMAVTVYSLKLIVIENREEAVKESVIHEFGHYLDYVLGFPSLSNEFHDFYVTEASTFKSNIPNASCVSDEREFFAETFYYSIVDLFKCTPKALQYVQFQLSVFLKGDV